MPGLWTPPANVGRGYENNVKAPVVLTAHATPHSKGTWTQLIASTAADAYGFWTYSDNMGSTGVSTAGLVDIGIGPTDPPTVIVPEWDVGWSRVPGSAGAGFPKMQYWPIFIPAGTKVWGRLQALITVDVCNFRIILQTGPTSYEGYVSPSAEAVGEVTASSRGTVVTSGAAVYGTAVDLGATSKAHSLWTVGLDGGTDTTLVNLGFFLVRLHIGSGTTAIIGEWLCNNDSTNECLGGPFPPFPVYKPVPAGTNIFASINATGTGDSLGIIAYGM